MRRITLARLLAALMLLALPLAAGAQPAASPPPVPAAAPPAAPAPPAAAPSLPAAPRPAGAPALTPQQAQQALDVLRDPQRRAEILTVLETLARAAPRPAAAAPGQVPAPVEGGGSAATGQEAADPPPPAPEPAAPPPPAPAVPLAPDSIGAQVIVGISDRLSTLGEEAFDRLRAITGFPLIALWLTQVAGDADRQGLMLDTLWRLALVMAVGLLGGLATRRLLRPLRARLAARAPAPLPPEEDAPPPAARTPATPAAARLERQARQSDRVRRRLGRLGVWLRRVPFGLAALALDLVPMLGVVAIGYALLAGGLAEQPTPRLVIVATLNAYVIFRLVAAGTRMLVAPDQPGCA